MSHCCPPPAASTVPVKVVCPVPVLQDPALLQTGSDGLLSLRVTSTPASNSVFGWVGVFENVAHLESNTELRHNGMYITKGQITPYDGQGKQYIYEMASLEITDGIDVVRPDSILDDSYPGRYRTWA